MKQQYQNLFNQIYMNSQAKSSCRNCLQQALIQRKNSRKKSRVMKNGLIAAVVLTALMGTAFAYREELGSYFRFFSGGIFAADPQAQEGENVIAAIEQEATGCVQVENGVVYFVRNGTRQDITQECGADRYYAFEQIDSDGNREVVLIGGSMEHVGYIDVIWLAEGGAVGNASLTRWEPWVDQACSDYEIDSSMFTLSASTEGVWAVFDTDETGKIIASSTETEPAGEWDERLLVPQFEEVIENGYPVNERGETYGPNGPGMDQPDLQLATGDEGETGYIRLADEPEPRTIEEALNMNEEAPFVFSLYLQDGTTVIGTFTPQDTELIVKEGENK